MNRYLLSITILLSTLLVNGQEVGIEWGKEESRSGDLIELMPFYGKDFYSLRWKGSALLGGYSIARHDDLQYTKGEKLVLAVNNSMANFERAITFNDHVIVILSDSKTDREVLYLQEYGYDLKSKGEAIELAEYVGKKSDETTLTKQ